MPSHLRSRRWLATAAAALLLLPALASCGGDTIADQARDGSGKGYVAGDGTVALYPADRRREPLELSGTTLQGTPWSMSDAAGKVLVVNLWGSWCAPCEQEAPHLVAAAKSLTSARKDVAFLGINVAESPETGAAAARRLRLPFPSLTDRNRSLGPALQNQADATPTTLVLDRQGRIAGRIVGAMTSATTLVAVVDDVVAEGT